MDTTVLTVVAIAVILLVALAGVWYFARRKNTERLRERFGPEYDKTVEQLRSQERAEKELTQREKRIRKYTIVALPESEKVRYRETWAAVQARFVDHPESALREAHELVREVMRACGYPLTDFEQSAADLSVDHPHVVQNYRAANRIAERSEKASVSTEDLRQALVHYRALFEDLLEPERPREKETEQPWFGTRSGKNRATHPGHQSH